MLLARVGIYLPGCAVMTPDGARIPALIGPMVETLADAVDRLTVIAHDPPGVARTQDEDPDFLARPVRDNIDVLSLGPSGTWRTYLERRKRVHEIASAATPGFDLLIVRLPNPRADTFFRGNRCERIVSVVLGYAPGVDRVLPNRPRKLVQLANTTRTEFTVRAILRASGIAVFNSEDAASHYRGDVPDPLMKPWSMRRDRFSLLEVDRLRTSPARFLICGRLTPTKGVFEALDVFARIRSELLPDARLDVIGDGDARRQMEAKAVDGGFAEATTFHGWVSAGEDLFAVMRNMDVMLHLSHAEGFPQVMWEALAHSVLILCTPVGGIPHALRDRQEALFVPVGDVDAAVRAVAELVANEALRRTMIMRGFERAAETSTERIVDDILGRVTALWPSMVSR